MPGRCVPGRGRLLAVALSGSVWVAAPASAQPTAGFPGEEEPPPAAPTPPAAPAPAPPLVDPYPPGAPPVAPVAPSAPLVEPYPATAPPPTAPRPIDAYGSGLPPGPAAIDTGVPLVLPYHSGHPVPPGYHVESRPATGLIVSGALTLSVGYVAALGIGLDGGFDQGNGWLAVPVVGPWAAIGARSFSCEAETVDDARECFDGAYDEATTIAILAVDGMIQATGLVILFAGLASGRDELVRDDAVKLGFSARQRPEGGFDVGVRGRF